MATWVKATELFGVRLAQALASVESETGEDYHSPEDRRPKSKASVEESRDDDRGRDGGIDGESEKCAASESHENTVASRSHRCRDAAPNANDPRPFKPKIASPGARSAALTRLPGATRHL